MENGGGLHGAKGLRRPTPDQDGIFLPALTHEHISVRHQVGAFVVAKAHGARVIGEGVGKGGSSLPLQFLVFGAAGLRVQSGG